MYPDASGVAPIRIDPARAETLPAPARPGLNWRHLATAVLLLVTLPVLLVAAAACIPVLLVGLAVQALRKVWALTPAPQARPAPRASALR